MGDRGGRIMLLLCLALVAAGCDPGGRSEVTSITVMVAGDAEEIEAYQTVVDAFNGSRHGIGVELVPVAERDELILRLSTSIAGGRPPDLFLMNYRYFGQFAARGALEPLGRYLDEGSAFSSGDFFAEAMAPFRWNGEQMCLPQNVSSLVVYYNADLFGEAGVSPPRSGWTWDDMVRASRALTRDTDGDGVVDVHGVGVEPEIIRLAPLIWSNGGTLVDDPTSPTRFALDARAVTALEMFLRLRSVDGVTPTDEEVEAEDLENRFLNGRLAMLFESRRVVPTFRTIRGFEWEVAELPALREPASILHSDAYCMTAASEAKDEAWSFVEFALGPDGQRITARAGRTVPSLRSVAESVAFLDPAAEPANSRVFLDQIPFLRAVPTISTWPEVEDIVNGLIEEAYYAGGSALELAIEMDIQTRDALRRAEG